MSRGRIQAFRVLAVDPSTRGFGFAVVERRNQLVDWGVKRVIGRNKNAASLAKVLALIRWYEPDVLVVEDCRAAGARRCARVRTLINDLEGLAANRQVPTVRISSTRVREVCGGSRSATKEQIAAALVTRFPELSPRLPPHRKPWMSEDVRMSMFDAVALAVTHFDLSGRLQIASRKPA